MWSDIFFWTMVGCAVILAVRAVAELFAASTRDAASLRDDQLESLIYSKHLQPDHYYLFVWDARGISHQKANDFSTMLKMKGFDTGFMRTRGIPPVVYDLKRPELPVEGIENE